MFKHRKLRFFVKKPQYPKTYFRIKGDKDPLCREDVAILYEHKPILVNDVRFWPEHVHAEAKKNSVAPEGLILAVLVPVLLQVFGKDISTERYMVATLLGLAAGALIGMIRIDNQRRAANFFNKSK